MRKIIAIITLLSLFTIPLFAQSVTIKGKVTDDKHSPIEIANVHAEGQAAGTITDLKGNYIFTCQSNDSLVIRFSMIGYQTRKRTLKNPSDTVIINISLPPMDYALEGVEIVDNQRQMSSTQKIELPKKMRLLPDASGNGIESIIATQAGVSSHSELSSQYNVRGGNFDENSVYVNGVEVYRPLLIRAGQQEGLSFLNPDMVGSIDFSTGGYEAKYGDVMSSVLDVTYRKPTEFESSASLSILGANAYIGVGNKKFSFTNSLRYKTTRYLLGTLDTKGEYNPDFIDYQTYFDWRPTQKINISFIGNISRNRYNFKPSDRQTSFGTLEEVREFKVYFDGWEKDLFRTLFGSLSLSYTPNEYHKISLQTSAFNSNEQETYDITGEYWIDDINAEESKSIGQYREHARNYLQANIATASLSGVHFLKSHDIRWGLMWKGEYVNENQREWEMRDSAGYNIPHTGNSLLPIYSLTSKTKTKSNHIKLYVQDTYKFNSSIGLLSVNAGARLTYWDWNNEVLFSPRASLGLVPKFNDNLTFRLSSGIYYQVPFYKELRDTTTINGITTGQIAVPYLSLRLLRVLKKSLSSPSHFVTTINFERPFLPAARRVFSAPTSTLWPQERTTITESAALKPSALAPSKSKRPGVSIIFTFLSLHSKYASADETETFLFFSSASKSSTVFPSATLPNLSDAPER